MFKSTFLIESLSLDTTLILCEIIKREDRDSNEEAERKREK